MIKTLFISVVNMSITASFAIIAVILIRFLIRKQPKVISYALWSVVLFRLLCPWSLPSRVSVYNSLTVAETTINGQIIYDIPELTEDEATVFQDITVNNEITNITSNNSDKENLIISHNITPDYTAIIAGIWGVGIVFLIIKNLMSLYDVKEILTYSKKEQDNIYTNDRINSAFVFGIVNPGIYLPENISDSRKKYIIRHEAVHIKRKDYIFKLMGFVAVCLHWFNPLVWLSFKLVEKDMEMACDEAVIRNMDARETISYSQTLLMMSSGMTFSLSASIAFNENNIKERIKNILNYKNKNKKYIIIVSAVLLAVVGIFAVNPLTEQIPVNENDIDGDSNTIYHIVQSGETVWEIAEKYNISIDSLEHLNPDIEEGIVPGEMIQVKPAPEVSGYGKPESIYTFFIKPDESLDVMAETAAQVYFNALGEAKEYSLVNYKISKPMDSDNEFANTPYKLANDFMYAVLIEFTHTSLPVGTPAMQMVLYIQPLDNSNYVIAGALSPVSKKTAIQNSENSGKNIWPLLFGNISRGYTGQYPAHNGLDIAADLGTHIFAVADGTVITVENTNLGYGIHCIIDHGDYKTLYAHCDALEVTEGQKVQQGQLIGYVGSTGNSTGPHLHLEVFTGSGETKVTADPLEYS